jgi:Uma2 family endonuclease
MTTGPVHDDFRGLFCQLINALTRELAIPSIDLGETTWNRTELPRGLEADQGYYFQTEKLAINAAARARKSNDVANYPNPDLAVEIDISPSQVDRPEIYAALQVAEVWRFDSESLTIEQLGPDGKYITGESSRSLPIRTDEVIRCVAMEDVSDRLACEHWLLAWIRAELRPRMRS